MINLKLTERDELREREREREREYSTVSDSPAFTEVRADRMLTHRAHLHNLHHSGSTR